MDLRLKNLEYAIACITLEKGINLIDFREMMVPLPLLR